MRCNPIYALFASTVFVAQVASGQQIPPAQQLKAPGTAQTVDQIKPSAMNPIAASQANASASAAPLGSPNVLTLSQARCSRPE